MLLPLALSVSALVVWGFAFAGIVDGWRARRSLPSGVMAALMVAVAGSVLSRLAGSVMYLDDPVLLASASTFVAHVQRALLLLTGLWALVVLLRARRAGATR